MRTKMRKVELLPTQDCEAGYGSADQCNPPYTERDFFIPNLFSYFHHRALVIENLGGLQQPP